MLAAYENPVKELVGQLMEKLVGQIKSGHNHTAVENPIVKEETQLVGQIKSGRNHTAVKNPIVKEETELAEQIKSGGN